MIEATLVQFHVAINYGELEFPHAPQGINLEFLVKPALTEINEMGIPMFNADLNKKIVEITKNFDEFCGFHLKQLAEPTDHFSFSRFEVYGDLVRYLVNAVHETITQDDEIELIDVHLAGDFSVYQGGQQTAMQQEAESLRIQSLMETQARIEGIQAQGPAGNTHVLRNSGK